MQSSVGDARFEMEKFEANSHLKSPNTDCEAANRADETVRRDRSRKRNHGYGTIDEISLKSDLIIGGFH